MRVKRITLGALRTNAYLVSDDTSPAALLIDAPEDSQGLIEAITRSGLQPVLALATHSHWDHIGGIAAVTSHFGIPFWLGERALASLQQEPARALAIRNLTITPPPTPTRLLAEGDVVELGSLRFEVRNTPGHWQGDISLYELAQGAVFAGDTLFRGEIGRFNEGCDLPLLVHSIQTRLLTLPDDTTIYPGHGLSTTIGRERTSGYLAVQKSTSSPI